MKNNLYYCHSPLEFLDAVDKNRERDGEEQLTVVQGDTGHGFPKLGVSRIRVSDLDNCKYTRAIGPGLV